MKYTVQPDVTFEIRQLIPAPEIGAAFARCHLSRSFVAMSEPIITVEGLSKRYLIPHNSQRQGHERYTALRDVIGRELWNIARKTRQMLQGQQVLQGDRLADFWALRDLNFDVKGEVVGIIGRRIEPASPI